MDWIKFIVDGDKDLAVYSKALQAFDQFSA